MGDLFGGEPETIERLFIGLMLPAAAAQQASAIGAISRAEFGLRGHAIPTERLHVTLIHVGDYANRLPRDVVEAVTAALGGMAEPGFDVSFDRVGSFGGAPGKHPHVLLGGDGVEALERYRERLFTAVRGRLRRTLSSAQFTPHVTLMYADARLPDRPIEPVGWRATEVELIHSEVGRGIYNPLGRWPLG